MKRNQVALLCAAGLSLAWACGGGGSGGTGGGSASGGGTASSGGGSTTDGGTGGGTAATGGGTAGTGGGITTGTGSLTGDGGFPVVDARAFRSALPDGGAELAAVGILLSDATIPDLCGGPVQGIQTVVIEIVNADGGGIPTGAFAVVPPSTSAQGVAAAVLAEGATGPLTGALTGTSGTVTVTQIDAGTVVGSFTAQLLNAIDGGTVALQGAFNVPAIVCP
jgi:hypothetical protein